MIYMGRRFLVIAFASLLAACDDPLIIIGDLPGFMRVTVGVPDSLGTTLDSLALRTRLAIPLSVAADSAGDIYVADSRWRIYRVTPTGRATRLLNHDPCFVKTCIGRPIALAVAQDNALIVSDNQSDKIWRLDPASRALTVLAGNGINGFAPDGTVATQAALASPHQVAILSDGRIAFAERNSGRIRVIGTDGVLGTLASNLQEPIGLAVRGNVIFVSEAASHTVRSIDLGSGENTLIGGFGAAGYAGDSGPATEALFNFPAHLAVGGDNLYISDQNNNRVRMINLPTGIVSTFAGNGTTRYSGNGRSAGETAIAGPSGIAVSRFGFLYITDSGHHIIWRTPIRANLR